MHHILRVLQALLGGICLIISFITLDSLRYVYQNHFILVLAGLSFLLTGGWFLWLGTKGDL